MIRNKRGSYCKIVLPDINISSLYNYNLVNYMFSNFIRIFLEQGATTSRHTEIPM